MRFVFEILGACHVGRICARCSNCLVNRGCKGHRLEFALPGSQAAVAELEKVPFTNKSSAKFLI